MINTPGYRRKPARPQTEELRHFTMTTVAFMVGLVVIWNEFWDISAKVQQGDDATHASTAVTWECRDRFLWIRASSVQTPRLEAVDGNGVHPISNQLASRCGYTISSSGTDGYTTFRASFYSCFTHNQDDEVFTFRLNVLVSDGGGRWSSQPVSAGCPGLTWTHREIVCEEDYMEVNVNREASCGARTGESGEVWPEASSQGGSTSTPTWQLMFLHSDGRFSSLTLAEAQQGNYTLTSSAHRLVLRSPYKQAQAEVTMVGGVAVEVLPVSLFFREKLVVVMVDMTVACAVGSGSFDGSRLLWEVPQVFHPLVTEGAKFKSGGFSLGMDNVLLDAATTTSRGLSLVQQEGVTQIGVPYGAEGGYRKSLVENNVYKEAYAVSLLYQHLFTVFYDDGSRIDTRHRTIRRLETPLICRSPVSLNKTVEEQQLFRVYLENVPAEVVLEEVRINGKLMSETPEGGFHVRALGGGAYELVLPFEEPAVRWKYMGGGVIHHSIDVNFTLTLMPQRESYYHHTLITARTLNAFPPQITAQCLEEGISFSVVGPHRTPSLWEVGVGHEALTSELVAQRGYRLFNHSHSTTLEVPMFSMGYTYERINLSNFYATFKLLLRDTKTLEVQTSTSKRCLFRTQDMIVCSADGTMTVVVTPTVAWPAVHPERTRLLDHTCTPKHTDGVRVLFEFKLNSCGTRAMVGDWYVVYENEIHYKRRLIADGTNVISRESQFRVTVRCFYPLTVVNRLSVDGIFRPETPGLGSVSDSHTAHQCPLERPEFHTQTNQIHLSPAAELIPSHLNELLPETQTHKIYWQGLSHPSPRMSLEVGAPFSNSPQRFDSQINGVQLLLPTKPPSSEFVEERGTSSGPDEEHLALLPDSSGGLLDAPVVEPSGSSGHTPVSAGLKSLDYSTWHAGPSWDQLSSDQPLHSRTDPSQEYDAEFTPFGSSIGEGTHQETRPISQEPVSYMKTNRVHLNQNQTGLPERAHPRRTIEPQGLPLIQKPSTQQTTSSKPSLYTSGTTAVDNLEQGLQSVQVKQDRSKVIHIPERSLKRHQQHLVRPDQTWQGHGEKVLKSVGVTEDTGAKGSIRQPTERLQTGSDSPRSWTVGPKEDSVGLLASLLESLFPRGAKGSADSEANVKSKALREAASSESPVKGEPISR